MTVNGSENFQVNDNSDKGTGRSSTPDVGQTNKDFNDTFNQARSGSGDSAGNYLGNVQWTTDNNGSKSAPNRARPEEGFNLSNADRKLSRFGDELGSRAEEVYNGYKNFQYKMGSGPEINKVFDNIGKSVGIFSAAEDPRLKAARQSRPQGEVNRHPAGEHQQENQRPHDGGHRTRTNDGHLTGPRDGGFHERTSEVRLGDRTVKKEGATIGISNVNGKDVTTAVVRPDGSMTTYGNHDANGNPRSIQDYKPGAHEPFRTATRGDDNNVWSTRQGGKEYQKQGELTVVDGRHEFRTGEGLFVRAPGEKPRFEPGPKPDRVEERKDGSKVEFRNVNGKEVTSAVTLANGTRNIYGGHDGDGNPTTMTQYLKGEGKPFHTAKLDGDTWTVKIGNEPPFQRKGKMTVENGEYRFQTSEGTRVITPDGNKRFEEAKSDLPPARKTNQSAQENLSTHNGDNLNAARGNPNQQRRAENRGNGNPLLEAFNRMTSGPEHKKFLADNGILPPDYNAGRRPHQPGDRQHRPPDARLQSSGHSNTIEEPALPGQFKPKGVADERIQPESTLARVNGERRQINHSDKPAVQQAEISPKAGRVEETDGAKIEYETVNGKEVTKAITYANGDQSVYGKFDAKGNPTTIAEYHKGQLLPFRAAKLGDGTWKVDQPGKPQIELIGTLTVKNGVHEFQTNDGTFARTPDGKTSFEAGQKPDLIQHKEGSKIEYRKVGDQEVISAITYPNGFKAVYGEHDSDGSPTAIKEYAKDAVQPFRTAKLNGDTWRIESPGQKPIELKGKLTIEDGVQSFVTADGTYIRTAGGKERMVPNEKVQTSPKPAREVKNGDGSTVEYTTINGHEQVSTVRYPNGFKAVYCDYNAQGEPGSLKEYAPNQDKPFREGKREGDEWRLTAQNVDVNVKGELSIKDGVHRFREENGRTYVRTPDGRERFEQQ